MTTEIAQQGAVESQVEGSEGQVTEASEVGAESGAEGEQGAEAVAAAPAYTPNFKFKVLDKELEIPEKFRALLKDADTEKEVREIFEKAHGIDFVKQKNQELRTRFEPIEKEHKQIKEEIATAQDFLKKGNFRAFADYLKLPKEMIYKYVLDELNYKELTPEQRAEYDRNRAIEQQNYNFEKQNREYSEKYQAMAEQAREAEFNMVVSQPANAELEKSYDSLAGKQGAFKQAVAQYALTVYNTTGKDLSAGEAIEKFTSLYGAAFKPQNAASTTQQQATPPASQQAAGAKPPVIPNVSGSGAGSPVKKLPKTLDDLRKMRDEMNRAQIQEQ